MTLRSSRRQFLARGGALAGVLTFTGVLPAAAQTAAPEAGAAPAAAATGAAGLAAARRETYRALAATVLADPAMRLDPAAADAAASEFAGAYATWAPEAQRRADRALDALERSSARPFDALDARG